MSLLEKVGRFLDEALKTYPVEGMDSGAVVYHEQTVLFEEEAAEIDKELNEVDPGAHVFESN